MIRRPSLLATTHGSRAGRFGASEWGLVATTGGIWGASFLFIAVGIEAFSPPVVTLSRLVLGALVLACIPGARRAIPRDDWPAVILLGVVWMGIPLLAFPIAEQWVASSVAGMVNGSMPVFAAVVAAALLRRAPGPRQAAGVALGFVGVVAVTGPSAVGADASATGVLLLVGAVILYGVGSNVAVPLQQRHGALPVTFRAQWVGLVVTAPFAVAGLPHSHWSPASALAMVPLGVLGSGVAYVAMITLVGRVGATRGAVSVYFTPVVAIVLGVAVRHEHLHALAVAGTALVIAGAWLTSHPEREVPPEVAVAGGD